MDDLEVRPPDPRHHRVLAAAHRRLLRGAPRPDHASRARFPDRTSSSSLIEQQRRGEGEVLYRVRRLPDDVRVVGDKALFDLGLLGLRQVKGYDLAELGARAYRMAGEAAGAARRGSTAARVLQAEPAADAAARGGGRLPAAVLGEVPRSTPTSSSRPTASTPSRRTRSRTLARPRAADGRRRRGAAEARPSGASAGSARRSRSSRRRTPTSRRRAATASRRSAS